MAAPARGLPGAKLTLMQGQENAAAYQKLPAALRAQIEAHPMVAQHGMPPHIAAMLMGSSARGGQTPLQAMRHHSTPGA